MENTCNIKSIIKIEDENVKELSKNIQLPCESESDHLEIEKTILSDLHSGHSPNLEPPEDPLNIENIEKYSVSSKNIIEVKTEPLSSYSISNDIDNSMNIEQHQRELYEPNVKIDKDDLDETVNTNEPYDDFLTNLRRKFKDSHIKPPYSYGELITMAIQNSSNGKLNTTQIYEYIEDNFPYYRNHKSKKSWQNSIRHNLSIKRSFLKCPGKEWTLKPGRYRWL